MKLLASLLIFLLISEVLFGQIFTLGEIQRLAQTHDPLSREGLILDETRTLEKQNLSREFLPKFSLRAKASYQSAVIRLPFKVPGIVFNPLSKDQYNSWVELNQIIYEGGKIARAKEISDYHTAAQKHQTAAHLHALKRQVNQLYFNILFVDKRSILVDGLLKNLRAQQNTVQVQIREGANFTANLHELQAEILKMEQRQITLMAERRALLDALELFTGAVLSDKAQFSTPKPPEQRSSDEISRSELSVFENQKRLFEARKKSIRAELQPQLFLFGQGGYGRPGLNLLKNAFEPYYLIGLRLKWSLEGFYTVRNKKRLLELEKQKVDIQRDLFLRKIKLELARQNSEEEKIKKLIQVDDRIVRLKRQVMEAKQAQWREGTITTADLIQCANALLDARIQQALHELQGVENRYLYENTLGRNDE